MLERDDALDAYLSDLRRTAKLSVEDVCQSTKIQARYVEALEAGRWGDVPSNTHLRAFSLAMASACGGDAERAAQLVRRVLAATAPVAPGSRSFDTPAPAPAVLRPAKPLVSPAPKADAPGVRPAVLAAAGPMVPAHEPSAGGLAAASARLRSLPLTALLSLLAIAGAMSYGAAWGVEKWKHRMDVAALETAAANSLAPKAPAQSETANPNTLSPGQAPLAGAAAADAQAAPVGAAPIELLLRARRACWLVLAIDGKRLPTVTLQDGDKLRWTVNERAVLLAGNIGALRVWWRGDNLGYLGELGQRANAIVFERGHAPRSDKTAALPLPSGVPE